MMHETKTTRKFKLLSSILTVFDLFLIAVEYQIVQCSSSGGFDTKAAWIILVPFIFLPWSFYTGRLGFIIASIVITSSVELFSAISIWVITKDDKMGAILFAFSILLFALNIFIKPNTRKFLDEVNLTTAETEKMGNQSSVIEKSMKDTQIVIEPIEKNTTD